MYTPQSYSAMNMILLIARANYYESQSCAGTLKLQPTQWIRNKAKCTNMDRATLTDETSKEKVSIEATMRLI
jgi:hypothetical protein